MLVKQISQFIADNFLDGDISLLSPDTELLALNIVDSASIFDLVDFIKTRLGVGVAMTDIKPDNFATINAMVAMIERSKTTTT